MELRDNRKIRSGGSVPATGDRIGARGPNGGMPGENPDPIASMPLPPIGELGGRMEFPVQGPGIPEAVGGVVDPLPVLEPLLLAQFAARQRAAQRAWQEAEISAQLGRERSKVDFDAFLRQLDQRRGESVDSLRAESAARNLAFQPAFVGVGMRDIRDRTAEAQAEATNSRAAFLAGIDRQINQARGMHDEEVAAIERDKARALGDFRQFINALLVGAPAAA